MIKPTGQLALFGRPNSPDVALEESAGPGAVGAGGALYPGIKADGPPSRPRSGAPPLENPNPPEPQ